MLCLQAWLSPLGCLSGVARPATPSSDTSQDPDNVGHLYTSLVEEIHSLMKENYGLSQSLKVAEGKAQKKDAVI